MTYSDFLSLTRSDLFRYSGRLSLRDHLYHYFLSPGYKYTWWMRFCAYLSSSKPRRVIFPLAWLVYSHLQVK